MNALQPVLSCRHFKEKHLYKTTFHLKIIFESHLTDTGHDLQLKQSKMKHQLFLPPLLLCLSFIVLPFPQKTIWLIRCLFVVVSYYSALKAVVITLVGLSNSIGFS